MNVPTITMNREAARQKLRKFRANIHRQADGEYEAAAKGYEALAQGTPLIDIAAVFRDCPMDANGYPRLAICRADREEVCYRKNSSGLQANFVGGTTGQAWNSSTLNIPVLFGSNSPIVWGIYAPIPMIPADVIPAKGQRKEWHILWEVEHWSKRSKFAPPSSDPLLLKHIGGTLYAVLAEWDLTPLEKAVMAGAMHSS